MRISDTFRPSAVPLAFVVALALQGGALAFDVKEGPAPANPPPGMLFKSIGDSLREGLNALSSGNSEMAVQALGYAAREGNVAAQWKLGRMYQDGEGVRRDDLKAYQHFSEIANRHADVSPDSPHARVVAQAFVALGGYHLAGIPNSRVKRNPVRATEMFHYAASYFDDADAQYHLGRIFSEGVAGPRDLHQAARWFNLAAEKGHVPAQARLGQMLFNGDGVPRQGPRGLMWMQVAANKAFPGRDDWVVELNTRARSLATEDERRLADAYLRKYERSGR
ncbi:MAG: sel1 repeat family protein [Methylobacterium sp.]|jgi:TPR repeat protein|nr:sel1 repeat family protein [Methylobacterium sp.]MCA3639003.1 sel1 repeat family protein [Methylobacterium sp.]